MATNRITTANDPMPSYRYAGHGTRIVVTRKLPGVVTVTTPGDHLVLVDHVPYYLDAEVELLANGEKKITRWHLVYRYGQQGDTLPVNVPQAVQDILFEGLDVLREGYGDELGVLAESEDDAADQRLLGELARQYQEAMRFVERKRREVAAAEAEIARVEGNVLGINARMFEVNERRRARSAASSS